MLDNYDNKVGFIGFICPKDGRKVTFANCISLCLDRCKPLPLLLSLMSDRESEPGVFHVTELLSPPQQSILARRHALYVDPDSKIWTTFGKSWHSMIEGQGDRIKALGQEGDWIIERPFEAAIKTPQGVGLLRGKPDLYHVPPKILWDFKTVKRYWVEKILASDQWGGETYHLQLNIYKTYGFPEAQELILECLVKDWRRTEYDFKSRKFERNEIRPIERVFVPILADIFVRDLVVAAVGYLLACERGDEQPRNCLESELWISKKGELIRCEEYCAVREFCPQYPELRKKHNGRKP